jgi:hypothetical protein
MVTTAAIKANKAGMSTMTTTQMMAGITTPAEMMLPMNKAMSPVDTAVPAICSPLGVNWNCALCFTGSMMRLPMPAPTTLERSTPKATM